MRPTRDQIVEWFEEKNLDDINIGIVCGEVSNNLIIFDFDDLDIYEKIDTPFEDFIKS